MKDPFFSVLWRALPLALCALAPEVAESDRPTHSRIDACMQFLQEHPVAPGHAGSVILLLKPLRRTTLFAKRRGEHMRSYRI